ncbi:MAG: ATP-binding protein [Gammaproteobacteria bacterium]|jgi:two-component system sensor histidine kinase GlrK
MALRRPRTLLGLILTSLGLVTLPLLVAVGYATYRLGQLTNDSGAVLNSAAISTTTNERLDNLLMNMERNARQYLLLGAARSLEVYSEDEIELQNSLLELAELPQSAAASAQLQRIAELTTQVDADLQDERSEGAEERVIAAFQEMDAAAETLALIMQQGTNEQFAQMQSDSERTQRRLGWLAATLVPVTTLLIIYFLFLIVRPIRNIDMAIRAIGDGEYSHEIEIEGPADIEALGRQLEWLRGKLEESTNEKNKFLRHMSHELKTPLANIREGSELLMDGSVGSLAHDQEEVADILRLNSIKLQRLIENLLTYSAWQSKAAILEIAPFDLKPLVFGVISQYRLAIAKSRIRLRLRVASVSVLGDAQKLRLILDNLMSNAVKFTPENGEIAVTAGVHDDILTLRVRDGGPGISPEDRDHIFKAFFQGKRLQGGPVGGTGIGLSIVHECVQAHHGSVEIEDTPDSGASFVVRLPVNQVHAQMPLVANE